MKNIIQTFLIYCFFFYGCSQSKPLFVQEEIKYKNNAFTIPLLLSVDKTECTEEDNPFAIKCYTFLNEKNKVVLYFHISSDSRNGIGFSDGTSINEVLHGHRGLIGTITGGYDKWDLISQDGLIKNKMGIVYSLLQKKNSTTSKIYYFGIIQMENSKGSLSFKIRSSDKNLIENYMDIIIHNSEIM